MAILKKLFEMPFF